jgi:hypothetical protein
MSERSIFIIKAILLLAILSIFVYILNMVYYINVIEKRIIFRKEAQYLDFVNNLKAKEIKYAFFGDSHAQDSINPEFIPNSYNFGYSEENYVKTYFKLKKIIEMDRVKIENAIIGVDMHSFSTVFTDQSHVLDELYYYSQFVPYPEIAKIKKESIIKVWLNANFPSFGNGEEFEKIFFPPELSEIRKGWLRNTGDLSRMDREKEARISYDLHFKDQDRSSPIALEYFSKILELVKKNKINLIILMYPVAKEYDQELVKNKISRDEFYKDIFSRVNDIHGKDYRVMDYYNIFFEHPEYFMNADHLNYVGAEMISRKFQTDINKIKK